MNDGLTVRRRLASVATHRPRLSVCLFVQCTSPDRQTDGRAEERLKTAERPTLAAPLKDEIIGNKKRFDAFNRLRSTTPHSPGPRLPPCRRSVSE
eukprot:Selendium_serpulae@DN3475_c0_g1_i4.p1